MIIGENYKEEYKDYVITTEYTQKSKLVGDKYYTAIAKRDGVVVYEYQSCLDFKDAVAQIKPLIDFKLSVEPIPEIKSEKQRIVDSIN